MDRDYGTSLNEKFASTALQRFYETSVAPLITNKDYEGQIKGTATVLNILQLESEGVQDYTGADFTYADIKESEAVLRTNQQKLVKFKARTIDKLKSYVEPENTLMEQKSQELAIEVDKYVLSFHTKAKAGNRIGTDYTAGTVAIDAAGNVTGSGTTFTAAMVGRGFKATGHSVWYRVRSFASATSIVIEQDRDDNASNNYNGGVIAASTAYVIEAVTPVTLNATNIHGYVLDLRKKLQQSKVPTTGRKLVINAHVSRILNEANVITRPVESATANITNGFMGRLAGFDVYENEQVAGNETNGFYVVALHTSAIVFAEALTENKKVELQNNFGFGIAMLMVYGAVVPDERKGALAVLFCK